MEKEKKQLRKKSQLEIMKEQSILLRLHANNKKAIFQGFFSRNLQVIKLILPLLELPKQLSAFL